MTFIESVRVHIPRQYQVNLAHLWRRVSWLVYFQLQDINTWGLRDIKISLKTDLLLRAREANTKALKESIRADYEHQKQKILYYRELLKEEAKRDQKTS